MSLSGEFTINGETGLQDADSLPTATLVINGNDNAASVTVTKKSTGRYKWSVTPPTASEGDHRQVIRFATVDGMSDARSVFEDFVRATTGDVSGGGDTIIVTPIQASVTNPRFTTRNIGEIPEGTAPADVWLILKGNGDPYDLSGKTLRFVVASAVDATEDTNPFDDVLTPEWKYETDDGITVGGDDNNQVTVQHDADKTVAGDYRYFLYNVTDRIVLAKGRMPVTPAVLDVVA